MDAISALAGNIDANIVSIHAPVMDAINYIDGQLTAKLFQSTRP